MLPSGDEGVDNLEGNVYWSISKVARTQGSLGREGQLTARAASDRDFHHFAAHKFVACRL